MQVNPTAYAAVLPALGGDLDKSVASPATSALIATSATPGILKDSGWNKRGTCFLYCQFCKWDSSGALGAESLDKLQRM